MPTDNPFYDGTGPNWDSIWAYGLRNPYRAYYDAPTGRLLIGDVGGNDYSTAMEEVNVGVRGANYGWPNVEGTSSNPAYTNPIYSYAHNGRDASITGGFVYHGSQFPSSYQGSYFFADYTQNWIKRLTFDTNGNVTGVFNFEPADGSVDGPYGDIVYLTEGPEGALYYVDLGYSDISGTFAVSKIRRIQYIQGDLPPVVAASATPAGGAQPLTFNFSSAGSSDPEGLPLTYLWAFGDGAASTSTEANPTHTYANAGLYQARLTVSDGVNSTLSPPISISAGNKPVITTLTTTPANNGLFRAGDVITYSAQATDIEDGPLLASAFTWNIDFLHEGHVHPGIAIAGVTSGSFQIPTSGHDFSGFTRYRITLTVTDSNGLQATQSSIVFPDKVNLTFDTAPGGLTLYVEGIAHTGPFVYDTLIGFNNTIEARNQTVSTSTYTFASWSDGGAQLHTITVPTAAQSYTANYTVVTNPLPSGLAAGWSFNEVSGTSATDSSGNGNTATLVNGVARTTGNYGGGLTFDGVNDYLTIPNSPSLNIAGSGLTLSMWIRPQALSGGDSVVLGKFWNATMTSPYYQYGLELTGGTVPSFEVGTTGGVVRASMGSTLALNQWSYLAVVFNGSQAQFYVNGSIVTTASLSATITARGNPFQLGADNVPSQFFKGSLDDVRIYARALTAGEIQTDMVTPVGTIGSTDPTPPVVQLNQPANGAVVRDIIVVGADATDNVGIAGVQFFVDGVLTGSLDTVFPYGLTWDTRTVSNGAHTLTAQAYDTSGNATLSSPVTVNVSNTNFFQNEILATGFNLPTVIKFLPDGRLLVAEIAGTIKIVPPPYTTSDPTPFLQLNLNIPGYAGLQQGIFDIALDPNFVTNHYYYVFYTKDVPNKDRLSRFTANSTLDGTIAGSELILYQDPQIADTEHHGGAVNFGNDGKIYFTTGDHFQGTPAQDLTSPHGKIHRINPDGTVPTDNPFYDGAGPHWDSIWAIGLRNPYRAYYDQPTGRLFIGDVGGNNASTAIEELNVGVRGANYGWPNVEGNSSNPAYTNPLYSYPHNGRDAAITSGFVYHGSQFPSSYQGSYFFADYTQNWIRRLTFDTNGTVTGVFNFEPADGSADGPYGDIVYLTEGPDGALYYLDLGYSDVGGTFGISKVRRIQYFQGDLPPVVAASATPAGPTQPLTFNFSSAGSSDPEGQPLSYQWTFGDGQTSTAANPQHTYVNAGQYQARLTVSDGVNQTISPPISISAGNKPVITNLTTTPANNGTFRAGDVITYSATAMDIEDGSLPASAFTWNIDFLHEGHVHPGIAIIGVTSGSFTIPTSGHDFSGFTRYRITLTVTDSNGLQATQSSIVFPEKVNLTFNTAPGGLTLYLDGIAHTAPFVYDTLIGFTHTIEARGQTASTSTYTFASWSDGGAQLHTISVPAGPQSYTASYTVVTNPLPSGLAAGWSFNEASGTSATDSSGNGNIATLVNGVARTTGNYGGGLTFDGVNDYLTIPNSPSLNIAGSGLTLSMWIRPQALSGGDSVVLGKFWNATTMTSPYYQYGLELAGGTVPTFYVGTTSGVLSASMGSALALGQWSHLAVVFDGSQVRYYLNGLLVTTASLPATITARGNPFQLGADNLPSQFFKGSLDEVRIYNRALTAQDVQIDMASAG